MTHFEQRGVDLQNNARTKVAAIKAMEYSCMCCVQKGHCWRNCDFCAIAAANEIVVRRFELEEEVADYMRKKKKKA